MHRKLIIFVSMLMTTLIFAGCGNFKVGHNIYEKVYENLGNMVTYKAESVVTVYTQNTQNLYIMRQYYKGPDKLRTEVFDSAGNLVTTTVLVGSTAQIVNTAGKKTEISHTRSPEPDYMLLSTFFDIYYKDKKVREDMDVGGEFATLTVDTGSRNIYRRTAVMRVDSKTIKPMSLELLGNDNNLYTRIEYKSIEINKEVDDNLFSI